MVSIKTGRYHPSPMHCHFPTTQFAATGSVFTVIMSQIILSRITKKVTLILTADFQIGTATKRILVSKQFNPSMLRHPPPSPHPPLPHTTNSQQFFAHPTLSQMFYTRGFKSHWIWNMNISHIQNFEYQNIKFLSWTNPWTGFIRSCKVMKSRLKMHFPGLEKSWILGKIAEVMI